MALDLTPASPPRITTLVLCSATGALSMNIFLPSMPAMARYFNVDYGVMQLAVSLFLAATAVLQLIIGPLSDRYGRRPTMIACFLVFLASTLGAIASPNFQFLLAMRLLQAFSAAGMVLSRAIVRDLVEPNRAASMIGYVTMGMALAPMVGPVLGGLLEQQYGWQSTFMLAFAFGLMAFIFVLFDLGETNRNPTSNFAAQFRAYPQLLSSRRFWGYALTAGFTSGQFFAFLGGGPFVASEILHLSPAEYGLYFGIISAGYIIGNFFSGRFSERTGINTMMMIGTIVAGFGMVISLVLFWAGFYHPLSLFGPVIMTGIGNGFSLPNAAAGIVSVRPHLAGSAAGLGSSLQIGLGSALAVVAGALLSVESGPFPLIWVMLATSIAGIATALYVIMVERKFAHQ
ncbi:MAG: multidrug effflux MFS transporter [Rhizobiaceae bacterium]